jgi:hypothetical protein
VDFLDPAENVTELLANIKEDFGPSARFQKSRLVAIARSLKGTAPAHPAEVRQYDCNAAKRADPGIANSIKNPMEENWAHRIFSMRANSKSMRRA